MAAKDSEKEHVGNCNSEGYIVVDNPMTVQYSIANIEESLNVERPSGLMTALGRAVDSAVDGAINFILSTYNNIIILCCIVFYFPQII
jgi:hypothetical protein